jgi:hypothetical protein
LLVASHAYITLYTIFKGLGYVIGFVFECSCINHSSRIRTKAITE